MQDLKKKHKKAKEWAQANPEKRRYTRWKSHIKKAYGLTDTRYWEMHEEQGGVCAICKQPQQLYKKNGVDSWYLAVDHCHTTNKVRGLLCNQCNRGIGMLGDTHEDVQRAADYLKEST